MFDRLFRRSASVSALCVNQPTAIDDAAERLHDAERRIAQLEMLLQQSVVELDQYRLLATTKATPKVSRKPVVAKAPKAAKPIKLSALEFWALHGRAVDKIRAEFGDDWKVAAPFGKTELVTLANSLRSCMTERGTKLRWPKDQRFPSAEYWADGVFPDGVTAEGDYDRADPDEAHKVFQLRAKGKPVPVATRNAAWHIAHGYVLVGDNWVSDILHRQNLAHQDAIAEAKAAKATIKGFGMASEPFADIDDDLAEAAD